MEVTNWMGKSDNKETLGRSLRIKLFFQVFNLITLVIENLYYQKSLETWKVGV